ncbi:MAG: hypothetical protein AAGA69_00145 [Pseudomonadota bacterium]
MTIDRAFAALTLMSLVAACQSTPETNEASAIERARGVVPVSAQTEAPDPGALGSYSIPSGRCGMVLWARAGTDTVPIFRAFENGEGMMEIDGKLTTLTRSRSSGEARATIPNAQVFQARGEGGQLVTVEANTVWGVNFPGGSYVERGTITLTGADGWSRVLPVAGIAGCKA